MVENQRYSYSIMWHVWVHVGVSKSSIDSFEFYLLSPKITKPIDSFLFYDCCGAAVGGDGWWCWWHAIRIR